MVFCFLNIMDKPLPLTEKYQQQLNQFIASNSFKDKVIDKDAINLIWAYFNEFAIAEMVVEKVDMFWNKLFIQSDKKLSQYFLKKFDSFIEQRLCGSSSEKARAKLDHFKKMI